MRIMVTGSTGQLGHDVAAELRSRGTCVLAADRGELDITDREAVRAYIDAYRPETVIHCAAYTAVDPAETSPTACALVNRDATGYIADVCGDLGIKLIYISTDYVFDGSGTTPYETDHETGPLNEYGRSKLEGEKLVQQLCPKHFIVRTSWVFGAYGRGNFVKTVLRLADTKDKITVVTDQVGSPTYSRDLAVLLADMAETEKYGTYHATNEEFCSFYEFAREIVSMSGKTLDVEPTTSLRYGAPANRPCNSRLSKRSLDEAGFQRLPTWQNALARYLKELDAVKEAEASAQRLHRVAGRV